MGLGWRVEDCWGVEEQTWSPITISAPGYLTTELSPELPDRWLQPSYDVVLERGVDVHYDCLHDDGTQGCVEREVRWAQCVSAETSDAGHCDTEAQTCVYPSADDARLVCTAGRYSGELAVPDEAGEALFTHAGTASLTVPGTKFCETFLDRHEEATRVILGKFECEGANAVRRKLGAGSYDVLSMFDEPKVVWFDIPLAEGEQKVLPLSIPAGHRVDGRRGRSRRHHGPCRAPGHLGGLVRQPRAARAARRGAVDLSRKRLLPLRHPARPSDVRARPGRSAAKPVDVKGPGSGGEGGRCSAEGQRVAGELERRSGRRGAKPSPSKGRLIAAHKAGAEGA